MAHMLIDRFILKAKRSDAPAFRALRSVARMFLRPRTPHIPDWLKPPLRVLYEVHYGVIIIVRTLVTAFYRGPLFQARCASVGKNLRIDGMPFVTGHVEIHLGDDVWLGGKIMINSGRIVDHPRLILKDHAEMGWNVSVSVNQEVMIEEYARVSYDCRISDSDGHPREADLRAQNLPVEPRDIRPVRIGPHAWIGNSTHIMKGVTIGEGAIIGANSVVIHDIPPFCLALGNPAEVLFRNVGRPRRKSSAA
jgi:acetyltransferase-like isoleucine patch superfamily enzyme